MFEDPALRPVPRDGERPSGAIGAWLEALAFVVRHRRAFVLVTAVAALLTTSALALALALPPAHRSAVISVTPTFPGVVEGRYPNRTPFSPRDIVAASVVEPVWRAQGLEGRIDLPALLRNLQVRAGGIEVETLLAEFRQKLSNPKLTASERKTLEAELDSRIKAIGSGTLAVVLGVPSSSLGDAEAAAFVAALPMEWARAADAAGVRAYDFPLPNGRDLVASIDGLGTDPAPGVLLAHVERMSDFSTSLADAVSGMSRLPGSDSARDSRGGSLVDLSQEVGSLRRNVIIPLYVDALARARSADPRSFTTIRGSRRTLLESSASAADERARVVRSALDDYASAGRAASAPTPPRPNRQPDTGVVASVGEAFVERVIEQAIKSRDVEFMRDLTNRRIEAELEAIDQSSRLGFETWLDQAAEQHAASGQQGPLQADVKALSVALAGHADRARDLMQVLAVRNLNSASSMFRVEFGPHVESERLWPTRTVMLAGAAVWAAGCAAAALVCAMRDRRVAERPLQLGGMSPAEWSGQSVHAPGQEWQRRPPAPRLPTGGRSEPEQ